MKMTGFYFQFLFTFFKVLTLTFFITSCRTFLYINVSIVAVAMQYLENVLLYS